MQLNAVNQVLITFGSAMCGRSFHATLTQNETRETSVTMYSPFANSVLLVYSKW